jgi:hypothetical protein
MNIALQRDVLHAYLERLSKIRNSLDYNGSSSPLFATHTRRSLLMVTRVLPLLTILGVLAARSAIAPAASTRLSPSAPAPHAASAQDDSLEQTLTSAERKSWVAWQLHDGKFFQSFLSDDHVEVGTNGIATKAQVVAYVSSSMCTVKSYSLDHFHATRFDDNTALLTYRAEQNTKCGKITVPSPTWVSSLYVRRNRKWVNALYQHTIEE